MRGISGKVRLEIARYASIQEDSLNFLGNTSKSTKFGNIFVLGLFRTMTNYRFSEKIGLTLHYNVSHMG